MAELLQDLEQRSKDQPFRGFRCWAPSEVGDMMHREAAAPSRAVLLATHQPPKIRRVTVTDAGRYGSDDLVTQEEVLDAVLADHDQSLIVPVIGASGSGKSHLVLWMHARISEDPSPNRKIIYLEKGKTSLVGVIDAILDGRTGSPFDEIRAAVDRATRTMDTDEAARRLRDELAVAARDIDETSAGTGLEPYRKHIKENIGALLDDPVYVTRLTGEGGPLRRIVEQARAGGSEEPAELKPEDLDIQLTAVELEDLSRPAKTLLGDLQTPALHEVAIDVLNEVRDRCLSRIFGVEPMQLVNVMRELRERLYEENPDLELVLMVEDFTLLQGIQHDLLEAMIELPRREGRQVMCAMKTVMAVTDGFFTKMLAASDTLRTRIAAQGHVYNLDVQYAAASTGAIDARTVVEFAGRYLNAVRAGAREIERESPGVPNACEHCNHKAECHDAFGTSGDGGYGLYPFNEAAIDRMVRSRQEKFNPRDLLAVTAQTLTTHTSEIEDGRFPSKAWERSFDARQHDRPPLPTLPLRTQEQVDHLPKPEQRRILLEFWGGAPQDLRNLPPGVHNAFDIPVVDAKVVVPKKDPIPRGEEGPVPESRDAIADAVQQWRDGTRLDSENARILRRAFKDAVLARLDPEDALYSPQFASEFFERDTDVEIDNAAGGGGGGKGSRFKIRFVVSNENALLFEGVLRAQRRQTWDFEGGHRALVAFLTRVEAEAQNLREYLGERLREREADHEAAAAALCLSGLIVGRGTPSDPSGLLAAAMGADADVSEHLPERWQTLANQCNSRRAVARGYALQAAHVSKSTADPAAIDGARFLPTMRTVASKWDLPEPSDAAPAQVTSLRQALITRLDPALEEAHAALQEWLTAVTELAGDAETVNDRAKAWRAALEGARKEGFLAQARGYSPDGNLNQLAATVKTVDGILTQWPEMDAGRRAAAIAKAPWARLAPLREDLEAVAATLNASITKAQTQQSGGNGGSPIAQFEEALDALSSAIDLEGRHD